MPACCWCFPSNDGRFLEFRFGILYPAATITVPPSFVETPESSDAETGPTLSPDQAHLTRLNRSRTMVAERSYAHTATDKIYRSSVDLPAVGSHHAGRRRAMLSVGRFGSSTRSRGILSRGSHMLPGENVDTYEVDVRRRIESRFATNALRHRRLPKMCLLSGAAGRSTGRFEFVSRPQRHRRTDSSRNLVPDRCCRVARQPGFRTCPADARVGRATC